MSITASVVLLGMRLMLAVVVLVGACGVDETPKIEPDASVVVVEPDAAPHPDNGFGNACTPAYNPQHLYTECASLDGVVGVCVVDTCRRFCDHGCPTDQMSVAGPENICWCEPRI